jgi:tRNA U34 2-thiouridine synthase MnmA/TrmU
MNYEQKLLNLAKEADNLINNLRKENAQLLKIISSMDGNNDNKQYDIIKILKTTSSGNEYILTGKVVAMNKIDKSFRFQTDEDENDIISFRYYDNIEKELQESFVNGTNLNIGITE